MRVDGTLSVDGTITGTTTTQAPSDNSTKLASTAYADAAAGSSAPHALLDGIQNNDTVAQSPSRGSLIYGNVTPKWDELVIGAANRVLRSDGTDASWQQVALATDVSGDLPFANFVQATAASKLVGRGSASGAGDFEEITIGTGLSMSGTTLSSTGGSGTVTTTGSPASGNLTKFSGATSITNGNLSGDVTTTDTLAVTIANSAVTLAKIANAAANSKLVGSGSAGSGAAYSEITLGTGLSMSSTTLNAVADPATATQVANLTLTTSQIDTLNATPITIVSAPGTNKIIIPLQWAIEWTVSNVWTNTGTNFRFQFNGQTQNLFGALIATQLGATRSAALFAGGSINTAQLTGGNNAAVEIICTSDANPGAQTATMKISLSYFVLSVV